VRVFSRRRKFSIRFSSWIVVEFDEVEVVGFVEEDPKEVKSIIDAIFHIDTGAWFNLYFMKPRKRRGVKDLKKSWASFSRSNTVFARGLQLFNSVVHRLISSLNSS
jgi:hypothetical protein